MMKLQDKQLKVTFILYMVFAVQAHRGERELLSDLFQDYHRDVRPVIHDNDTIVVQVEHTFEEIIEVDEPREFFVTNGWTSLRWKDSYLTWLPNEYNGVKTINISPEKIWHPDIVLFDDIKTNRHFGANVDGQQNQLTVDYTGQITWGLRATYVTKCQIDMHDFPFDTQSCALKYGSWSFEKGRLDLSRESRVVVDKSARHYGWTLENYTSDILTANYTGGEYEFVKFSLIIKRKALFYSVNLILPPSLVAILISLSFLLPAESGERMTLSITLVLAIICFIVGVSHLVPKGVTNVPAVYKFFMAILFEIMLLIFSVTVGMRLYHKKAYGPPMSQWIRSVILDRLSYWVGIRKQSDKQQLIPMETNCHVVNEGPIPAKVLIQLKNFEADTRHESTNDEREIVVLSEWRIVGLTVDRCLFLLFIATFVVTIASYLTKAFIHMGHSVKYQME